MIFTPSKLRVELEIERDIEKNWNYKNWFAGFSLAINRGRYIRASSIAQY